MTVYVVRDASGEYIGFDGGRTPASNEALEFETLSQAEEACERESDTVLLREEDNTEESSCEVCGMTIQEDASGVGHCWRIANNLPENIRQEIECEIIDGGNDDCDDYVASNGIHYRW